MKKLTIMLIPDGGNAKRHLRIPELLIKGTVVGGLALSAIGGYFTLDYWQLSSFRQSYKAIAAENEGLKGEARLLMQNLDEVKRSLRRVQDYTAKLSELTTAHVEQVSLKTGIGPLTKEEYKSAQAVNAVAPTSDYLPLGLNIDKLAFRPAFDRIAAIGRDANEHALELQHLLSNLSQQKSLLSSIPSIAPVDGWVTSGFGLRTSPFTGDRAAHAGLDIAAPPGTPVLAPADGVVIFTGFKDGFGNFIMIAHGYGIVSRYGHNHQNMVQPGQKITRGEQIATVGMTGRTTGPHLHYEILLNGRNEDPQKFILKANDFSFY